jgi:hypothetical protein
MKKIVIHFISLIFVNICFTFNLQAQTPCSAMIVATKGGNSIANFGTVCKGDNISLSINDNLSSPKTYAWSSNTNGGTMDNTTVTIPSSGAAISFSVTVTEDAPNTGVCTQNITLLISNVNVSASNSTVNNATCEGAPLSISASGGTSYSWSGGSGTIVSPNNFNSNVTGATVGTHKYTVIVTDNDGCTASASTSITINPKPTVSASVSPTNVSPGAAVTVSATSTSTVSYIWSSSPSGTNNNTQSFTANPTGTTTYFVTVTNTTTGCTNTASAVVNVTAPVSSTATASNPTVCPGGLTILNANAAGGIGSYTYSWSNGASSATANVNPTQTTTYTVTVTSGTQTTTSSVTITVVNKPSLPTPSNVSICAGLQAKVSFSAGTDKAVFDWTNTNTNIGLAASGSSSNDGISFLTTNLTTNPISGTIKVKPKLINGANVCEGDEVSFTIIVKPTPTTPKITDLSQNNSCGVKVYKAESNIGSYNWTSSPTGIINNLTASQITVSSPGSISVTASLDGCVSAISSVNDISIQSQVVAPGKPTIAGNKTAICLGSSITLSVPSPSNDYDYEWSGEPLGAGLGGEKTPMITIKPSSVGTFKYKVLRRNKITLCPSAFSEEVSLTVYDRPREANISTSDKFVCENTNATIRLEAKGGTPPYTFTVNGEAKTNDFSALITSKKDFTLTKLVDANSCEQDPAPNKTVSVDIATRPSNDVAITSDAPNGACVDASVIITLAGKGGSSNDYKFTYKLNGVEKTISGQDGQAVIPTKMPQGGLNIIVTKIAIGSCDEAVNKSLKIEANPTPVLTVSALGLSGQELSACKNADINLNVTSNIASNNSFQWIGAVTPTGAKNGTASGKATDGTITVKLTEQGCTGEQVINVKTKPLPDITIDTEAGKPRCETRPINLIVKAQNGIILNSYSWNNGLITPSINITPTQKIQKYSVSVTSTDGCLGNGFIDITGAALPSTELKFTKSGGVDSFSLGNNISICANQFLEFILDQKNSYDWGSSNGTLTNNIFRTPNLTAGSYPYSFVVKNKTSQCESDKKTFNVDVGVTLPVKIEVQNGSKNAKGEAVSCNGSQVTLKADAIASSYSWTKDGFIFTGNNAQQITQNKQGTYKVIADDKGCKGEATITLKEATIGKPTISNIDKSICSGQKEVTLNVTPNGGTSPYKYTWSDNVNSADVSANTKDQLKIIPTTGDNEIQREYTVIVTDNDGCTATEKENITVKPVPNNKIQLGESSGNVANDGRICVGQSVTLSLLGNQKINKIEWEGLTSGSNLPIYTFIPTKTITTFAKNVENSFGCILAKTEEATVTVVQKPQLSANWKSKICIDNVLDIKLTYTAPSEPANVTFKSLSAYSTAPNKDSIVKKSTTTLIGDVIFRIKKANFNDAGLYGIIVTDSEGCVDSIKQQIDVVEIPRPVIVTNTSEGKTPCKGQTVFYRVERPLTGNTITWEGLDALKAVADYDSTTYKPMLKVTWKESALGIAKIQVKQSIGQQGTAGGACEGTDVMDISISNSTATQITPGFKFYPVNNIIYSLDNKASCYQWGKVMKETGEFVPIPNETFQAYVRGANYFDDKVNNDTTKFKIAVLVGDGKDGKCTCASLFISAKHREEGGTTTTEKVPLTLYPNPNNGTFNLKASDLSFESFNLQIFDVVGRLVHQEEIATPKGVLQTEIQPNITTQGVYFAVMNVGGKRYKTLKFVVQY